ncbi:MAG: dicarboxylate/amino acid:cation symporter [Bacteroidales bacterium]|nr:dicarboxylate/amino acid:cation symporter [Bacteroidales bacterium]
MKTILKLLAAVAAGIVIGLFATEGIMGVMLVIKQVTGQLIFFLIPLIIIGFVAPSIAQQKGNVSKVLLFSFGIAYLSSIGAAFFSEGLSKLIVPALHIDPATTQPRALPEQVFNLEIPPVMSVMSALVLSVFLGIGTIVSKSEAFDTLLKDFQKIVLYLVKYILMPLLPFYIAANFACLAYEGNISRLKVFLPVILIVILAHYVWLLVLYLIASVYTGKNGWKVVKHYAPAYFTALGTMSSAATLGVSLQCAQKSEILDDDTVSYAIPLFANIHLCGSVLTEVFFVSVTSQLLYGTMPSFGTMALFIFLLGIFAVGAPGVPGGTVLASLGLVISILGFNDAGTALLIALFALQDSFGTACNVTGDGALALMVQKFKIKNGKENE